MVFVNLVRPLDGLVTTTIVLDSIFIPEVSLKKCQQVEDKPIFVGFP